MTTKTQPDEPKYGGWYCPHCNTQIFMASQNMVDEHLATHTPPQPTTEQEWRDELKILINEWMFRMIKFGEINLPRRSGFTVFECPDLEPFIQQEIDRAVLEVFDMLGTGHDLFLEWREYVKKQYDNPEKETRVVDSFEYWLDRKIDLIKFKIKNV